MVNGIVRSSSYAPAVVVSAFGENGIADCRFAVDYSKKQPIWHRPLMQTYPPKKSLVVVQGQRAQ